MPHLELPALGRHDAAALLGTAVSLFVVILAQSTATSRAYAGKYEEAFSEDTDLVGLGAANVAAALSGSFVANGSPTQTQVVDSAGGRSQLAQLTTSAVVLIVLLLLTGPLASLPIAALAAIVFLIAAGLIDVAGMRRILRSRNLALIACQGRAGTLSSAGDAGGQRERTRDGDRRGGVDGRGAGDAGGDRGRAGRRVARDRL